MPGSLSEDVLAAVSLNMRQHLYELLRQRSYEFRLTHDGIDEDLAVSAELASPMTGTQCVEHGAQRGNVSAAGH